jgi:hypothetical protein
MTCMLLLPFFVALSLSQNGLREWALGVSGMEAMGLIIYVTHLNSLLGVILYTWQRYMVVCRDQSLSLSHSCGMITLYSCLSASLCSWCIWSEDGEYTVSTSGTYAQVDWSNNALPNRCATAFVILCIFGGLVLISFTYYTIDKKIGKFLQRILHFHKEQEVQRSKECPPGAPRPILSNTASQVPAKSLAEVNSERQRRVLLRSVSIVVVYLLVWSPYGMVVIYEFFTGVSVSGLVDAMCCFLLTTNPVANFVIFVCTNPEYANSLKLRKRSQSRRSLSNST